MRIVIGGDLVPTKSNIELFLDGDIISLFGEELLSLWQESDFRIFNLEVPLTDEQSPIFKCGPNLIAPSKAVKGIKALNPSLVTLANNHILDQGIRGLKTTEELLNTNQIPFVGVGDYLDEASKPYILEKNKYKIGVYACVEHEFSIATESTPGANPFDPLESFDHIQNLKSECDYVIVLYHGGKEHYRYPSPYIQKVCRKMAQKGADLIVCQHSHCVGCYEEYEGATIVYGQGNLLFDRYDNEFWQTGLLVRVEIAKDIKVDYIPIVKKNNIVAIAKDKQAEDILKDFYRRSEEIKLNTFVERNYAAFARANIDLYMSGLQGDFLIYKIINKLCNRKFARIFHSSKSLLWIKHVIECEAHREMIIAGLENIKDKSTR